VVTDTDAPDIETRTRSDESQFELAFALLDADGILRRN
jgi:hypothetical protein